MLRHYSAKAQGTIMSKLAPQDRVHGSHFTKNSPYKTSVDTVCGAQDVFGSACVCLLLCAGLSLTRHGLVDLVAYRACFAVRRQTPRPSQTCSLVTFSPKSLHL